MGFQLGLKPGIQGEPVSRRPGKPGEHPVLIQAPDLPGTVFDDRLPQGHLAITGHDNFSLMANGEDGGGVGLDHGQFGIVLRNTSVRPWPSALEATQ